MDLRGVKGGRMLPVIKLILTILQLYTYVIIIGAILSWLIAFGVVNIRNDIVRAVWNLFLALTEPFLRPIRKFLPNTGGIDISPIILLLAIMFIQWIIQDDIAPLFF
jgi:YggT family protein